MTKMFTYPTKKEYRREKDSTVHFMLDEKQRSSFTLRGDVKIKFRHHGFTGTHTFCRIMFNTAFIQNGNYICAGKMQLSPEDIRKD